MEINNIVSNTLSAAFPRQQFIFTNTKVEWKKDSRQPLKTTETLTLTGRMQPANYATISRLGFNINNYELYTVYLSNLTITQIDKLKQLGCSTFTYNNETYKIIGKMGWDTNQWREFQCYRMEADNG